MYAFQPHRFHNAANKLLSSPAGYIFAGGQAPELVRIDMSSLTIKSNENKLLASLGLVNTLCINSVIFHNKSSASSHLIVCGGKGGIISFWDPEEFELKKYIQLAKKIDTEIWNIHQVKVGVNRTGSCLR